MPLVIRRAPKGLSEERGIDLCDPEQEPSDASLARIMARVAQEAIRRKEQSIRTFHAAIDHEIAKALPRMS